LKLHKEVKIIYDIAL